MKILSQTNLTPLLALAVLTLGTGYASAEVEIAYPDTENTLFTIEVPKNWKLTPMDQASKFFLVEGPRGVKMWFRAMPIDSESEATAAAKAAKESGREWLSATHENIVLDDGTFGDRDGLSFLSITGTATVKGSNEKVKLIAALATMTNGAMGQMWCLIPESAPQGDQYARKVIDSFTPR
ncbi:MAG: hypothetical protein AAF357_13000 [Verrucomicrobiota bacterium]